MDTQEPESRRLGIPVSSGSHADALLAYVLAGLFVVLTAAALLLSGGEGERGDIGLPASLGAGLLFGMAAYGVRALDAGGAVTGGAFAVAVVGLGGWAWAVPSFTFFALSSLWSYVGRTRKAEAAARTEKGGRRDAAQVLANGGVAWVFVLGYVVVPHAAWYVGFLGAMAAATADTWGTELGTLARRPPRMITSFRRVAPGTSGAVSWPGTLGGIAGALVIWLVARPLAGPLHADSALVGVWIVASGLGGTFMDSLLGATLQARFFDPETGEETEHPARGSRPLPRIRGLRWLRNDAVNACCTLTGGCLAAACFLVLDFAS